MPRYITTLGFVLASASGQVEPRAPRAAPAGAPSPVYLVTVGDVAIPLACYDPASRRFHHGAKCLDRLSGVEIVVGSERLRAKGRRDFTCGPTEETFPALQLERRPRRGLAWRGDGTTGVRLVESGPASPLRIDLDGDGALDELTVRQDRIVMKRSGSGRAIRASSPDWTGTFKLLGTADADGDGRLELFFSWDYGQGWGYAMVKLVDDKFRTIGHVECGS